MTNLPSAGFRSPPVVRATRPTVTCHVGRTGPPTPRATHQSGHRYTSREILQCPVDEAQDRSLACFDILPLLLL
jgi:hypothetical protein